MRFGFTGIALLMAFAAFGHGGGTNADGCHTKRKTGEYHCHGSKRVSLDPTYCHLINGDAHCGYALASCADLKDDLGGSCVPQ